MIVEHLLEVGQAAEDRRPAGRLRRPVVVEQPDDLDPALAVPARERRHALGGSAAADDERARAHARAGRADQGPRREPRQREERDGERRAVRADPRRRPGCGVRDEDDEHRGERQLAAARSRAPGSRTRPSYADRAASSTGVTAPPTIGPTSPAGRSTSQASAAQASAAKRVEDREPAPLREQRAHADGALSTCASRAPDDVHVMDRYRSTGPCPRRMLQ